mmetsp:Transcript_14821/g.25205  ORF Transcript_14821/g.25205 Transcript_14821/m.25205 type:complete len:299 (-) Transcript_14821:62-958(-)
MMEKREMHTYYLRRDLAKQQGHLANIVPSRSFFNKNKKKGDDKKGDKPKEETQAEEAEATETKEKMAAEEGEPKVEAAEEAAEKKEDAKKSESSSSTSDDEYELTAKDIKKVKALIADQDETIEKHEAELDKQSKQIKELKQKLIYQMAENDNTVKRYRKQIEDSKVFAIQKFAKELLDVRDSLALALQHVDLDKVEEMEDIELLKEQFKNVVKGQEMTTGVMDKVLGKFDVLQFDPIDEKFDPNNHDAVFIMPAPVPAEGEEPKKFEHDTVGTVMQTGWKIGDRVLRAAKVGIIKKN